MNYTRRQQNCVVGMGNCGNNYCFFCLLIEFDVLFYIDGCFSTCRSITFIRNIFVMLVVDDIYSFESQWDGCVVTMGNFDGLHLGHQELIETVLKDSKELNLPSVLISYQEDNPKPFPKIVNKREKVDLLAKLGFSALINIKLDDKTKNSPASEYLQDVLINRLKAKRIIIGYDHAFGKARLGDFQFLKDRETQYDFVAIQIPAVLYESEPISSTCIRKNIKEGSIKVANSLLGRAYNIRSKVIHGLKRGKKIGFATANLSTPNDKVLPKMGVYLALVSYDKHDYKAVVNVGLNPTFNNKEISIEVHFLDFDKDIYDEVINVCFLDRLRDEIKFDNSKALKQQIEKDIVLAKSILIDPNSITIMPSLQ